MTQEQSVTHVKRQEFQHWPKISRLSKETCFVSEKLDGTNGIIHIDSAGNLFAGSRNRWLYPGDTDNYGFRAWTEANKDSLMVLGEGTHYGEWYGQGVQRGYGLNEKRFALFVDPQPAKLPSCCSVVPWLYSGNFNDGAMQYCLSTLLEQGSRAVPGWMKPEGFVVHLKDAGKRYKVLCENDTVHKWAVEVTK